MAKRTPTTRRPGRVPVLVLPLCAAGALLVVLPACRSVRADPEPVASRAAPTTPLPSMRGSAVTAGSVLPRDDRCAALLTEAATATPGRRRAALRALRALGETAPVELRPSFVTLSSALEELAVLDPVDLAGGLAIIERPDVTAAMAAVGPYLQDVCA